MPAAATTRSRTSWMAWARPKLASSAAPVLARRPASSLPAIASSASFPRPARLAREACVLTLLMTSMPPSCWGE
eukprot:8065742-Lingulodinium_polyedra.AAC.1